MGVDQRNHQFAPGLPPGWKHHTSHVCEVVHVAACTQWQGRMDTSAPAAAIRVCSIPRVRFVAGMRAPASPTWGCIPRARDGRDRGAAGQDVHAADARCGELASGATEKCENVAEGRGASAASARQTAPVDPRIPNRLCFMQKAIAIGPVKGPPPFF